MVIEYTYMLLNKHLATSIKGILLGQDAMKKSKK